jgi:hypothetical protein
MDILFSELFEKIDKAKSRKEKIDLLKQYETPALRGLLKINFHPDVQMSLPEGEPPFKKEADKPMGYQETNLLKEYKRFYIWLDANQQLPKVKKEKLFIEMLEGLHISEATDLILIKDKSLQKKYKTIKEDLVREVFPFLLPPKTDKEKSIPLD